VGAERRQSRLAAFLRAEGLLVAIAGVYGLIVLVRLSDELTQDSWFALVGGREIVHHGLPRIEHLTYLSSGHRWTNQPWLAQLLLYLPAALGGVGLALVVNAMLVTAGFAAALAAARSLGGTPRSIAWTAVVALLPIAVSDAMRTQSPVYLLFVPLVWLLARDSRSPTRLVWLCLPMIALWTNLHGSAVLAAALVALRGGSLVLEALIRRTRPNRTWIARTLVLIGAPWLCLFASPYGFELYDYYDRTLNNPAFRRLVVEWQAPTLGLFQIPLYVLAFGCAVLIGRDRTLTVFERLALVLTMVGAFISVRNEVWFGYTALILLPGPVRSLLERRPSFEPRRLNSTVALAGVVAFVVGIISAAGQSYESGFPAAGADVVARAAAAVPEARIYAHIRWADWLLWREPQLRGRIAYDTRLELLSDEQLTTDFRWENRIGDDWRKAAAGARLIVLDLEDESPIENALLRDRYIRRIYRNGRLSVLERRD
jgi:hypothetical protein